MILDFLQNQWVVGIGGGIISGIIVFFITKWVFQRKAGKGLLDTALLKQLKKGVRGILPSTVTVKSQICGVTPRSERIFECGCH